MINLYVFINNTGFYVCFSGIFLMVVIIITMTMTSIVFIIGLVYLCRSVNLYYYYQDND